MSSIASLHFEKGTATLRNRDKIDDGVAFEVENESFKYRVDKDGVHINNTGYINGFDQDELTANKTSIPSSSLINNHLNSIYSSIGTVYKPITKTVGISETSGSVNERSEVLNQYYTVRKEDVYSPNNAETYWSTTYTSQGEKQKVVLPTKLIVSETTTVGPFYGIEWTDDGKTYYAYYDAQECKFIRYTNGFGFYIITADGLNIKQESISRNNIRDGYIPKLCLYDENVPIFVGGIKAQHMNFEWIYDEFYYQVIGSEGDIPYLKRVDSIALNSLNWKSSIYNTIVPALFPCTPARMKTSVQYSCKNDISWLFSTTDSTTYENVILSMPILRTYNVSKSLGLFCNQQYLSFEEMSPQKIDLKGCTDTSMMFRNCKRAGYLPIDLSDMSTVINAVEMFKNFNSELTTTTNITFPTGSFDSLKYAGYMFDGANFGTIVLPSNFKPATTAIFSQNLCQNIEPIAGMFANCKASSISGLENWDISDVRNLDYAFAGLTNLTQLPNISNWNTSNVESLANTFDGSTGIQNISAIANWNVSNVKTLSRTFANCTSLASLAPLANWNVSNVKTMYQIFADCSSVTSLSPLANWDVSNVEILRDAFKGIGAETLTGLENWDVSNVTSLESLFRESQIKNIDALSNWDVSNIKSISGVFDGCLSLTNVNGALNWDTHNATTLSQTFRNTPALINISGLKNWDISNITYFNQTFLNSGIDSGVNGLGVLSNWDVSSVKSFNETFKDCNGFTNLDYLDSWKNKLANVERMESMFNNCSNLSDISGIKDWNVSNVRIFDSMFAMLPISSTSTGLGALSSWNMSHADSLAYMFNQCQSITNLNALSSWNVSNVKNFSYMFYYMNSLNDIGGLSNWNVSSGTDFTFMFAENYTVTDISPLTNWNTENAVSLHGLLKNSGGFTDISALANWNVSHVADFGEMFMNTKITSVSSLANWDTGSGVFFSSMFRNCNGTNETKFTTLNGLENWNVSNAQSFDYMFMNCSSLSDISAMANWNVSNVKSFNAFLVWKIN